jgi:hypothetical protein
MTNEEIDAEILAYAKANDCVAELCHYVDYDPQIGKVAELIVQECSAFVYNYPEKYLTRNQAREICMSMEEHFGVEE